MGGGGGLVDAQCTKLCSLSKGSAPGKFYKLGTVRLNLVAHFA